MSPQLAMGRFAPAPCRGDDRAAPVVADRIEWPEGDMEVRAAIAGTLSEKSSETISLREEEEDPESPNDPPLEPMSRQSSQSSTSTDTSPKRLSSTEALRLFDLDKHYSVGPKLGQGSYGSVYSVEHVQTGKAFALKTVLIKKESAGEDIKAEIRASVLDHPYIVKLHAFFCEDNQYHLVMDLCTGGNLMTIVTDSVRAARKADRRYNAGLQPKIAGRYAWQMLNGLEFLHHCGLIHRDIKPENYLLQDDTPTSPLKLADFGFACRIGRNEKLKRSVGSVCYAAPELLKGSYDQVADIWSLGVSCFWMCTNTLPFEGFDEKEYLKNVRASAIKQYDCTWKLHLPCMRAMVLQMLTRDPAARPSAEKLITNNAWLKAYDRRAGVDGCCVIS